MEEENSLMESAEDAEEEMLEGEQRDEIWERQDMGGADICENGENEKETFMDEASELAENAIGLKDATMEAAAHHVLHERLFSTDCFHSQSIHFYHFLFSSHIPASPYGKRRNPGSMLSIPEDGKT